MSFWSLSSVQISRRQRQVLGKGKVFEATAREGQKQKQNLLTNPLLSLRLLRRHLKSEEIIPNELTVLVGNDHDDAAAADCNTIFARKTSFSKPHPVRSLDVKSSSNFTDLKAKILTSKALRERGQYYKTFCRELRRYKGRIAALDQ